MRVGRGACWVLAEKFEINRSLVKPKRRYEYNIRTALEVEWEATALIWLRASNN